MSSLDPAGIEIAQLSHPDVIADPYPYYAALRDRSPVYGYRDLPPGTVPGTDEPPPSWAVLSHAQVTEVARHPEVFSSRDPLQEASGAPTLMLVNHDDPTHAALRARVQRFFTASNVAPQREWLARTTTTLIDQQLGQAQDAMHGIAADLPAMVMTRMLGAPLDDYPRFRGWATAFMLSAPMTPVERSQSNADMFEYFTAFVGERAGRPRGEGDLVTSLLAGAPGEIELSIEEVIRFCFTLVVAGSETTTGLIGNLLWIAATQPEAFTAIRQDPGLIDRFIEEALRWAGPPQRLFRIAGAEYALGGATIRKDDWVAVFFAAANRDPAVWEEPDRFRLARSQPRAHYSFGHGVHQCLGAMLVRLEARAFLESLCRICERVEPVSFERQTATQLSYALHDCTVVLHPSRMTTRRDPSSEAPADANILAFTMSSLGPHEYR